MEGGRGRAPGITTKEIGGPLQEEKNWESSLFFPPTRRATEEEKKLILALCVEQGLLAAFDGHLYNWNREVRSQSQGLGIGEDLTRLGDNVELMLPVITGAPLVIALSTRHPHALRAWYKPCGDCSVLPSVANIGRK